MALALAACQPAQSRTAPLSAAPSGLAQLHVTVRGHGRSHVFVAEVAASPAAQQRGLMYRETLAPDRGMLFPFPRTQPASFWMKNTRIPLDLLFIRDDGTIANIAARAEPMSLALLDSDGPVAAVLEIRGGRAGELGIRAGDKVRWPR